MNDKREDLRIVKRLSLEFALPNKLFTKYTGVTRDISRHGAFVMSAILPPVRQKLRVTIQDGSRRSVIDCEVVHHTSLAPMRDQPHNQGFGVRFLNAEFPVARDAAATIAVPAASPTP